MNQTHNLYQYLYQMLVSQLFNGTFLEGQEFPSQREICRRYNVGITTVRKVMKMLDEQGYIRTAQGRPSIVAYRASKETHAALLVQRRQELADAYRGLGLLMPALYREGAKRCRAPELRFFHQIIDNIPDQMEPSDHYRLANAFFTALLRPLENQLIMDLELDSENYLHVPYFSFPGVADPFATTVERTKAWFQNAIRQIEQKRYDEFYASAARLYRDSGERVDRYLRALGAFTPPAAQVNREYHWFRVKDRSELYARVAMTIIRRIIAGEFDGKKYLPSIPMLMEAYGVTKNTARRAVALLNALGFAQTIDKKGTVIAINERAPAAGGCDLAEPIVQERLSLCLNALQVAAITARSCAASISSVPAELTASLENRLHAASGGKMISLSYQLVMNSLIELTPHHSLKNIFQQLNDLIIWGHYLQTIDEAYYFDYSKTAAAMAAFAAAMKNPVGGGLPDAFHNAFSLFYQNVHRILLTLPDRFQTSPNA